MLLLCGFFKTIFAFIVLLWSLLFFLSITLFWSYLFPVFLVICVGWLGWESCNFHVFNDWTKWTFESKCFSTKTRFEVCGYLRQSRGVPSQNNYSQSHGCCSYWGSSRLCFGKTLKTKLEWTFLMAGELIRIHGLRWCYWATEKNTFSATMNDPTTDELFIKHNSDFTLSTVHWV